jgi:hypothetical protein
MSPRNNRPVEVRPGGGKGGRGGGAESRAGGAAGRAGGKAAGKAEPPAGTGAGGRVGGRAAGKADGKSAAGKAAGKAGPPARTGQGGRAGGRAAGKAGGNAEQQVKRKKAAAAAAPRSSRMSPPSPPSRTSKAGPAAGVRESRAENAEQGEERRGNGLLGPASIEDGGHLGVHGLGPGPEALAGLPGGRERSGKYVYCIMQAAGPLRFGSIGIGSETAEVHTVNYRDIAAVVSDTPLEVYDPTRENVLAHERVNEAVMREHTVIPMSFNTVFKTREDIIELLRTAYDAFRDVLGKMQDKLEFGLKVVWDPELVIREIEKENENLRLLRQEISSQTGSTYFARMQYGRLVDSLLQDRSEHLVSEIFAALADVAVASRANKPIGDKMILNAAFLVARDRESDFDVKVKEIDAKYANLKFKYTGPWPPYNFVNIRLKLERAAEAE